MRCHRRRRRRCLRRSLSTPPPLRGRLEPAFAIGRAPAWAEPLHALLVEALEAVERLLHPGASAATLDATCRRILDGNGAGAVFPHHTGHGLGVFAQEAPFLVPGSSDVLAVGDIVAVEPGLYRTGRRRHAARGRLGDHAGRDRAG